MSDEESFVILGTSPNSSLDMQSLSIAEVAASKEAFSKINGITDSQLTMSSSSNASQFGSVIHNGEVQAAAPPTTNGALKPDDGEMIADCICIPSTNVAEPATSASETASASAINSIKQSVAAGAEKTLATCFIMGEVNSDVLKTSVYSQFPSIRSPGGPSLEDVVKMQDILCEYVELKKTLLNTNITMKQFYDQSQKWKTDVNAMEEERRKEIAKLRNENLELRRDLEAKIEQININEELRRKENEELVRRLSEKSAQIENMSVQIRKLEQHQLATFEYISKTPKDSSQSNDSTEYVSTLEHQRVVKDFERQMSRIVAENLDLKDMQNQYIDEINCLKVNLVSAEELIKKAHADINFLKSNDFEKNEMFTKFEDDNKALKLEMDVLRHQVDIYSRDFKIEQEARENLSNEKDQLLSDLRELQRKNQQLIEEAQKNYEEHSRQVMAGTGAFPKTRAQQVPVPTPRVAGTAMYMPPNYNCPVCGRSFKTLGVLQSHVNHCLDGARN